ncbi:DUF3299 domain-containing protein [Aliiglaciecola sp. M165]|uniref:DUF3299 domain-containing protein n=1 Tax=Aliiglaciecola sp. M165 TaxID=2593649 RepID=UPI00117D07F8|nr:DUF3299 domain-containing protein [Aliiglaciecola sp. M165]TRY33745.1 DUF3299 domain-containing protein [Aliiglaciecola sp. M165]
MSVKAAFATLLMLVIAAFLGFFTAKHSNDIVATFKPTTVVYTAKPHGSSETMEYSSKRWEELIPEQEREVLSKYQAKDAVKVTDMVAQILNSIESANDEKYKQAMISSNTVSILEGQSVSLPGFIVPVDFYPNRQPKNIFLVPYFGACIHFPPPPPNQIIFIRLEPGFSNFDLNQAYTIKGKLKIELFEDLMGTSAYSMDVAQIKEFNGEPDTFRKHTR